MKGGGGVGEGGRDTSEHDGGRTNFSFLFFLCKVRIFFNYYYSKSYFEPIMRALYN